MNQKKIICLLVFIFSFIAFIAIKQKSTWDTIGKEDTLTIGIAAQYAPFISMNGQGEYEGFDIDVASALSQQLGKKIIFKDCGSMTTLMLALEQNKVDALMWGLSITANRLKKYTMVQYQGKPTTAYCLLFWQNIPSHVTSIEDMNGMKVCTEPGSSQSAVLSHYKNITIISTEKVDDALLNIQYGKANAAFVEPAIAKKFSDKFPEIKILNVPLEEKDYVQGIGIVIKKNNRELYTSIFNAISILKNQGIIAQLEEKWGING